MPRIIEDAWFERVQMILNQNKKAPARARDKEAIERRVFLECRKLLSDSNMKRTAQAVAAACKANCDSSSIKKIKSAIKETEQANENFRLAIKKAISLKCLQSALKSANRKEILHIILKAVYLWDGDFMMFLNGDDKSITIDDILLDEIEENMSEQSGSCLAPSALPNT